MTHKVLAVTLLLLLPATAVAQQPTPQPTTVDASRGGVTIASGVNSLTIGARAQVRWTLDDREQFDADAAGGGDGAADGAMGAFDIPRLRISLSGVVYRPWLRYQFQFEMGRTSGEGGSRIKDAVLEIRPPDRPYRLLLGQFKVPFGLQQLTSSGRLQFVDRAITDAKFNPARDIGVAFGGTAAGRRFGYDVGVFNGSGESNRQRTRSYLWVGRVFVDPLGPYSPAEAAVEALASPVLHLGAGIRGGDLIRGRAPAGMVTAADSQLAYNVEFAFKTERFFSTAEHFWMIDEQENPTRAADLESRGYHAQAGYILLPRRVDAGVRYARIDPHTGLDDDAVAELRGVVGYYWQGHNLKLQGDVGRIAYGSNFAALSSRARQGLPSLGTRLVSGQDLIDTQLRVQMQLAF